MAVDIMPAQQDLKKDFGPTLFKLLYPVWRPSPPLSLPTSSSSFCCLQSAPLSFLLLINPWLIIPPVCVCACAQISIMYSLCVCACAYFPIFEVKFYLLKTQKHSLIVFVWRVCFVLRMCFSHANAHQEQMVLSPVCLFSQDEVIGEKEKRSWGGRAGLR